MSRHSTISSKPSRTQRSCWRFSTRTNSGRELAYVFQGDRNVNIELVELGLAIATTPDETASYGVEILAAEAAAHEARTGLWSNDACGQPLDDDVEVIIDAQASVIDPPGPDDRDLSSEIVFVVNQGNESIDVSGWILRDESSRHRYVFPPGTVLVRGERFPVTSASGWSPGGTPVWNNGGDMALLQDPNGIVISRWRY